MSLMLFFQELENIELSKIKNGKQFEKNMSKIFDKCGFKKMSKKRNFEKLNSIKNIIFNDDIDIIKNKIFNDKIYSYFYEPFGSQSFPDYLIILKNYIIPIEIKFSLNTKSPVWNGSLPRSNAIYIFASKKENDLTYFKGEDLISKKERKLLNEMWDKLNEYANQLKKENNFCNDFGFDIYLRKTFQQNKKYNKKAILNYFNNNKRKKLEQNVISFIKKLS